ncbi:MAG: hypothetical protein U9Q58_01585 [Pseudomonadota bacterium]|nr:hypothetical protein [Pseudomonadota bacterium]
MEFNIPHVTGGVPGWTDELIVDNMGDATEDFWVHLYKDGGGEALNRKFTIPSMETMTIDLKAYARDAQCGCVVMENRTMPLNGVVCMRFRLRYTSDTGGIAEFELSPMNKSQLAFNFSENNAIDWKGLAIMNTDTTTAATTTFYAIYGNGTLSPSKEVIINPNCKLVGFHKKWFPTIDLNDIQSIIVSSVSSSLCGVCISGSSDSSRLLFTKAGDGTRFRETNINTRYMVDTKLLEGNWVFNITFPNGVIWAYSYNMNRLSGVTNAETGYLINGRNGFGEALTSAQYWPVTRSFTLTDTSLIEDPGFTYRREYTFTLDTPSLGTDYYSVSGTVDFYVNGALQNAGVTFTGMQVSRIVNNNPGVDE